VRKKVGGVNPPEGCRKIPAQTDRTGRSDSIGRTVLQTVAQKLRRVIVVLSVYLRSCKVCLFVCAAAARKQ